MAQNNHDKRQDKKIPQAESNSLNEDEIWFDNVDPSLLEQNQQSAYKKLGNCEVIKLKNSQNIPHKILCKEDSFKG